LRTFEDVVNIVLELVTLAFEPLGSSEPVGDRLIWLITYYEALG
jgi:hypothetical protein